MAKIQEYQPQVSAPEPMGGLSPNLEVINQLGSGVERFGRQITDTSDAIESRSAQLEAADAQSQIADAKADFQDRIHQETASGTLNQQQILDDYDGMVSDQGAKFDTPRGKAEFERASSRTRGQIQRWMGQGAAQIAGSNQIADHVNTVNKLANSTLNDPNSFADNMDHLQEYQEGLKNDPYTGQNQEALSRLNEADKGRLAAAAIQGHMNNDYNNIVQDVIANGGKIDPTNPKYNTAEGMLNSGFYDQFLPPGEKERLLKQARENYRGANVTGQAAVNAQSAKLADQQEQWKLAAVDKLHDNQLNWQDIKNSPLDSGDKMKWANMMEARQKNNIQTNPAAYNDLSERMSTPDNAPGHISDLSQINDAFLNGQLTSSDHQKLTQQFTAMSKDPLARFQEQALLQNARNKMAPTLSLNSKPNPDGEYRLMLFNQALQRAKQNAVASGQPSSVLDQKSKDYFGNNINQFSQTPHEILKTLLANQNTVGPTNVQTMPGPNGAPLAQPQQPVAANKPNEVERLTKSGRMGIYNPETKQFIRWK